MQFYIVVSCMDLDVWVVQLQRAILFVATELDPEADIAIEHRYGACAFVFDPLWVWPQFEVEGEVEADWAYSQTKLPRLSINP